MSLDEEFELLFNASPHPYLILLPDDEYTIIAVNEKYLAATSTRRGDIVGLPLFQVFPDNPNDSSVTGVSDLRMSLDRVIANRVPDTMGVQKYDIPSRDGSGFTLKYWSPVNTPVLDKAGNIVLIIHHVEDITEFILAHDGLKSQSIDANEKVLRMEAEVRRRAAEVKEVNRHLYTAMEQLDINQAKLKSLNERLKELDRLKTEFFSNVSHEFRTPLTLILGLLDEVTERDEMDMTPQTLSSINTVRSNALRLLKLVNTLLDFSRIEAGRTHIDPVRFEPDDFSLFTAALAGNFKSACEQARLRLSVNCNKLPEPVYIDPDMWEKIVLNLVSNAFKYTFDGFIEVCLDVKDNFAELVVRDSGIGISSEELPHIFERFHRVKGALGRTNEGTGIGLALVRELITMHGGTIHVKSEPGRGSVFIVNIPLGSTQFSEEAASVVDSRKENHRYSAGSKSNTYADSCVKEASSWLDNSNEQTDVFDIDNVKDLISIQKICPLVKGRIVLAEDNIDMRNYLKRILSAAGYEVEAVSDGAAAIESILRCKPVLLITDVMMPRMDGFELLKRLRDDPDVSLVPVLMLSARAGEEARVEGFNRGADDYIVKPFSSRELIARVEGLIRLYTERHEAAAHELAIMDEHNKTLRFEIERRKSAEEQLKHQAYYDSLTDLPNRMLFYDRLNQSIMLSRRKKIMMALIFFDMDHFKEINDTFGHDTGDEVLKVASSRLKDCIRNSDTVARMGGDEFTIILTDIKDARDVSIVVEKIRAHLAEPFEVSDNEFSISGSIGIALYPGDGEDEKGLLKSADEAMYHVKRKGRGGYSFFSQIEPQQDK